VGVEVEVKVRVRARVNDGTQAQSTINCLVLGIIRSRATLRLCRPGCVSAAI
jgi:hypothetical protein